MHVEAVGQGPALVMLHGWAMHAGIFAPLTARLRERFTLYLVDLPGHGASPDRNGGLQLERCVQAIADAVPEAVWLGWSLGGLVALHAAQRRDSTVRGLIMLCATPRFVQAEDWNHGVAASVFTGFAEALAADYRGTLDRFLALECLGSEHALAELRALREGLFQCGEPATAALSDGLALLSETDLRAQLPELAMPTLWIAGRRDRLVDWRAVQEAAKRVPRSCFERIDGAGHAPFLGHADTVAAQVDAFVMRCSP